MRLTSVLVLALAASVSFAQDVWEKPVAPGLVYRMEVDRTVPRVVHALRLSLKSPAIQAVPALPGGTVFEATATKGRGTVSEMVTEAKGLGGINGDFFPFTGDPLGLMVRGGRLLSSAERVRASFGWGQQGASATVGGFEGTVGVEGAEPIVLDAVNRVCAAHEVVLNTPAAGRALSGGTGGIAAILKVDSDELLPTADFEATVTLLAADATDLAVEPGTMVLVGMGNRASQIAGLAKGQVVRIKVNSTGFEWDKVEHVMGGGPLLVRQGQASSDWEAEGFNAAFALKRHPRTAVGVTADGDAWFVVVDGRSTISDGATIEEMTSLMLRLGCVDAVNLDGGGSSALNLLGLTLNRPSDGDERPIANGVVFQGEASQPAMVAAKIAGLKKLVVGEPLVATVVDAAGKPLPNADILWSAAGDAWIDQGGTLRGLKAGKATVAVAVGRIRLTAEVEVVAPPVVVPPKPAAAPKPKPKPR